MSKNPVYITVYVKKKKNTTKTVASDCSSKATEWQVSSAIYPIALAAPLLSVYELLPIGMTHLQWAN